MFNDHRRCVGGMLRAKSQSRALPALLVALTISLSLSGCVAGTFDRHFGNERPEATGRVLLSIGEVPKKLVNSPYTEDALNFRQLGGSTGMVRYRARGYWGGWIDGDFDDERGHGEVRLIHLEPGDYRIENFLFSRGPGNSYAEAKDKFSIPFTVKAGETVYLGRYMFMGESVAESSTYMSPEAAWCLCSMPTTKISRWRRNVD